MQKFGIGLEAEGFTLDKEGNAVSRIQGKPTIKYVFDKIKKDNPAMLRYVSEELASCIIEIKSDVFADGSLAISQILSVRAKIDEILKDGGCRLVFQPVLDKPFDFVAADDDPASRSFQLVDKWKKSGDGEYNMRASSICSLQINDSRPFKKSLSVEKPEEACLGVARKIHNVMSSAFINLAAVNEVRRDYYGKTRLNYYFDLVRKVQGPDVIKFGGGKSDLDAVIPPYFADVEAMKKWMASQSGVEDFADADCKNEHAVTVKIKRKPYYASETRLFDAVDDEKSMSRLVQLNSSILLPFYVF